MPPTLVIHGDSTTLGLTGEACHADTLRRLRRNADRLPAADGGCIASWLDSAPGAYHLKFIPVPSALDRNDLRFAVEDELDWDDAELLCETVSDEDSQWQELTQLVISNDDLAGIDGDAEPVIVTAFLKRIVHSTDTFR